MTLPSAEAYALFNVMFKSNIKNRPEDFTLTDESIAAMEKKNTQLRVEREKANPPKPTPAKVELAKLRNQLFDLQQQAKSTEQKVNNVAGKVKLLETRLTAVLKNKAECEAVGNLVGARSYEHQAQQLETELDDARLLLIQEQRYNSAAARQLRAWQTDFGPQLLELKKQVGG